jgi:GTP cyclohydrolase I
MSAKKRKLPDVALENKAHLQSKIDRVGMTHIEVPLIFKINKETIRSSAKAAAFISLDDPNVKGIHMSRLFSRIQELAAKTITAKDLEKTVKSFQESHKDISKSSELRLNFEIDLQRKSLTSNMTGWRNYPVECVLNYEKGEVKWKLGFQIVYSSTCPCSAALSRQLIQEKFLSDFGKRNTLELSEIADWISKEDSVCATPHSQRSFAKIEVSFKKSPKDLISSFLSLIEKTEATLKTPVQSFVKRSDEQEFARLNAENLMFCEDAARRIHDLLESSKDIQSYNVEVEHQESLHPHNAVARVWSK